MQIPKQWVGKKSPTNPDKKDKHKNNKTILKSVSKVGSVVYNRIRSAINMPILCGQVSSKKNKGSRKSPQCCPNEESC